MYVMQNLDSLGKYRIQPPAYRKILTSDDGKEKPYVFTHEDDMLVKGVNLIIKTLDDANAPAKFYDIRLIFFIFADDISKLKSIITSLVPGYRPSRLLAYLGRLNNDLMTFMRKIGKRGTKLVDYSEFVNRNVDLTPIRPKKGEKREQVKTVNTPTARNTRVATKPQTPLGKTNLQVLLWKVDEDKRKESETLIQDFLALGYDFSIIPFLTQSIFRDTPQDEGDQKLLKATLRDMLTYFTLGDESRSKAEDAFGVNLQRWTFTSLMSNLDKVIKGKTYIKLAEREDVVSELKRQTKEEVPEDDMGWEKEDIISAFEQVIGSVIPNGTTSPQYARMDKEGNWVALKTTEKDTLLLKYEQEGGNPNKDIIVSYKGEDDPKILVDLITFKTTAVLKGAENINTTLTSTTQKQVKSRSNNQAPQKK